MWCWPIKPDVVFDGGNVVKNAAGAIDLPCPDVCLLSTNYSARAEVFRAELGDERSDRTGGAHGGHHRSRVPRTLTRVRASACRSLRRADRTDADPPARGEAKARPREAGSSLWLRSASHRSRAAKAGDALKQVGVPIVIET